MELRNDFKDFNEQLKEIKSAYTADYEINTHNGVISLMILDEWDMPVIVVETNEFDYKKDYQRFKKKSLYRSSRG